MTTESPKKQKKDPSLVYVYDFTIGCDFISKDDLCDELFRVAKKWIFQHELSDTGYDHFQGRLSLYKKRREHELKNFMKELHPKLLTMHHKPTALNSLENGKMTSDAFYCLKSDTHVDGPWSDITEKKVYVPRQYRNLNLKIWQHQVRASKDVFDSRRVNFLYDPKGNNGKSTLASLCELQDRALALPLTYDPKQLMESVCDILMSKEQRDPKLCFIDLPRGINPDKIGAYFVACEEIKKGKAVDMRHRYKEWWFDSPQVWVFANWLPNMSLLSADRWLLWTIVDDVLTPFNPEAQWEISDERAAEASDAIYNSYSDLAHAEWLQDQEDAQACRLNPEDA